MDFYRINRTTAGATALGCTAVALLLTVAAPGAGTAQAHGYSTPTGDAVGRPGLDNPAPLVRLAQALGDHIFNQNTPANKAWDDSVLGQNYHSTFGTPDYTTPTHGHNGTFTGLLNMTGMKESYNAATIARPGLPDEANMPGTLIRLISAAPTPTTHDTTPASAASRNNKSVNAVRVRSNPGIRAAASRNH